MNLERRLLLMISMSKEVIAFKLGDHEAIDRWMYLADEAMTLKLRKPIHAKETVEFSFAWDFVREKRKLSGRIYALYWHFRFPPKAPAELSAMREIFGIM